MEKIETPQTGEKPVLLIDVDGVLLTIGADPPDGWESVPGKECFFYNPQHGAWLRPLQALTASYYMTSHRSQAHDNIGRRLGLDEVPYVNYIKFEKDNHDLEQLNQDRRAAFEYCFPSRAVAWIDDEFTNFDRTWAAERNEQVSPTLLVQPETEYGLQEHHIETIRQWLGSLAVT
jgi:hypothetical protein